MLLNQCPHNLDLWQWICGMPATVDAHMAFGKWHDIEVEDDVTAFVTYPNGATGVFVTSTGDAPRHKPLRDHARQGQACGRKRRAHALGAETPEPEFSAQTQSRSARRRAPAARSPWRARPHSMWACSTPSPGRSCAASRSSPPGQEGIRGLTISNAMHLSAWLGHEVPIPFDEDLFYSELMKRVKTSRRKEHVSAAVADLSGTYGGAKS